MARSVDSSGMADSKKDKNQTVSIVNEHGTLAEQESSQGEQKNKASEIRGLRRL